MSDLLVDLLTQYGYAFIFCGILLENGGIPSPGHTLMLAGGFFAHEGKLSLSLVLTTGCAAAFLVDNIRFWAGRKKGIATFNRFPKIGRFFFKHQERFEQFVKHYGTVAVVLVRFVPGLQLVGAFLFGASRMNATRFVLFNLLGAAVWSAAYGLIGYFFGSSWNFLHAVLGKAGLLVFILFVLAIGAVLNQNKIINFLRYIQEKLGPAARATVFTSLVFALFVFFFKLTSEMREQETSGADQAITKSLSNLSSNSFILLMQFFSALASLPGIIILAVAGSTWALVQKRKKEAVAFAGVLLTSELLNLALKKQINRARPTSLNHLVEIHGSSYPSGHSMAAASAFFALAFLASKINPRLSKFFFCAAFLMMFAVGISRIALGAHFPTDVLAGFCAGLAVALTGEIILDFATLNRKNDREQF